MDWTPELIKGSCAAAPHFDRLIENRSKSHCLFHSVLSILLSDGSVVTEELARAFRRSSATANIGLREIQAVDSSHISTTARVSATIATLTDPAAPCSTRELLWLCAWLGLRFEVVTFPPGLLRPTVVSVPSERVSTTADGSPLRFAGSLAFWYPTPTAEVAHWEGLRCDTEAASTPVAPPTPATPTPAPFAPMTVSRPVVSRPVPSAARSRLWWL